MVKPLNHARWLANAILLAPPSGRKWNWFFAWSMLTAAASPPWWWNGRTTHL